MVKCPECGSDMEKFYTDEEIDKIRNIMIKFDMKRTFKCPKCGYMKMLYCVNFFSRSDISTEYVPMRLDKGDSKETIISDLLKKANELKKEFKE